MKTQVRRTGGLAKVDLPGVAQGIKRGDVVEVATKERAERLVSTGEWELVEESAEPTEEKA